VELLKAYVVKYAHLAEFAWEYEEAIEHAT
jgi:hypothetical protein